MPELREVSKEEFFASVRNLDVHPRIVSSFPYRSEWRLQRGISRQLIGVTQDYFPPGKKLTETRYFLPISLQS